MKGLPSQCLEISGVISKGKSMLCSVLVNAAADNCVVTVYDGVNNNGRKLFTLKAMTAYSQDIELPFPIHCEKGIYVEFDANTESVMVVYDNYKKGEDN